MGGGRTGMGLWGSPGEPEERGWRLDKNHGSAGSAKYIVRK